MTRKNTTHRKSRTLTRALAALAVVLGAGLIAATPARADGPHFSFSFGLPFPLFPGPVPVYEPPRYYEPAPESTTRLRSSTHRLRCMSSVRSTTGARTTVATTMAGIAAGTITARSGVAGIAKGDDSIVES